MRKIEQQMIAAIRAGKSWSSGNTQVSCGSAPKWLVHLHGNLIAEWTPDGMRFTLAGWPTRTTRSRINALLRAFVNDGKAFHGVGQDRGNQFFYCWPVGGSPKETRREISSTEWVQA